MAHVDYRSIASEEVRGTMALVEGMRLTTTNAELARAFGSIWLTLWWLVEERDDLAQQLRAITELTS